MKRINYDTKIYNFREYVEKFLGFLSLETIHEDFPFGELLVSGTDQNRHLHRKFYNGMDSSNDFISLYRKFIQETICPLFDEEIIFQKFPTFRIHQPNNIAVFAFHKDKEYNHNENEVNFYLPITKAFSTNTFWFESEEDKGDFSPMEGEYGEVIQWKGSNLKHGNKLNETNQTRISFDFRILSRGIYNVSSPKKSKSKNKSFTIGNYYDAFK
jgi:hypothetical protein